MIVYTTSMTVVRESADKCKAVRNILQTHMVRYEEKDLFMSAENQKELLDRLGTSAIVVPQVFADGIHIGVRYHSILGNIVVTDIIDCIGINILQYLQYTRYISNFSSLCTFHTI